jgi:putative transposase
MARKRFGAEQVIPKLREAEVEIARGATVGAAAKKIGVTEQTFYRWKKEYGGLKMDQAKRLKELEKENARHQDSAGRERDSNHKRTWAPVLRCCDAPGPTAPTKSGSSLNPQPSRRSR